MPTSSNSGMEGLHRLEQSALSSNAQKKYAGGSAALNAAVHAAFFLLIAVERQCRQHAFTWPPYETQRQRRQHARTAASPPDTTAAAPPAGIHSGMAATRDIAAMQPACISSGMAATRDIAAMPPACISSGMAATCGTAASVDLKRHCRQHMWSLHQINFKCLKPFLHKIALGEGPSDP